jgi:hypothetical protein
VASSPFPPADWLERLRKAPGVSGAQTPGKAVECTQAPIDLTPTTAPNPLFLADDQAGTYMRVTFGSPDVDYDQVLYIVSNLGFRLADPCYDQAQARGASPDWHLMGQEQRFAASQSLILATTSFASNQWEAQLRAASNVASLEIPFGATC